MLEDELKIDDLLNIAPYGWFIIGLSGQIIFASKMAATRLGKTTKEIIGTTLTDYFPSDIAENRMLKGIEAINSGTPQSIEDNVGGRWYFSKIIPIKDKDEKIISLAIFSDDITERKKAENVLRESEDRFKRMVKEAPLGIAIVDSLNAKFYLVNPALARITGLSMEELEQIDWESITHPDDIQPDKDNMAAMNAGKIPGFQMEKRYLNTDGKYFWVNITVAPMFVADKSKPRHLLMVEGITDRKRAEMETARMEAQNQQLQKAESLGRMAGAIAHHFNNQLSVMMGNLELVLDDLTDDADNRENLFQAFEAGRKAAEVSQQMLRYLGHISGSQTTIDLSNVSRKSLALLQSALPSGFTLNVDFPDSGPFVHADAGQIQQVLNNLFTNAQESFPDNQGIIGLIIQTVSHEDISTLNRFPLDWQPQDNPYACLEISDTGCGIFKEDIVKIFDPFYTTKFTGRGMGLPVTMGILKTHDGCITVDSEPESGTVFRVYLPVTTEKKPVQYENVTIPKRNIENGDTVLLIEDEASVRNTSKAMLIRLGYGVIEAQDGVEAMRLFQEHQNEIDCVLSDLTMPRMNGWETLTALREKGADVPVILASGYDEATVMAGDHPELPQGFLNKPYSMAALKDVLMEVIRL